MATRTFLKPEVFEDLRGQVLRQRLTLGRACSELLSEKLFQRVSKLRGFEEAGVIVLGSLARGEVCPQSDIDCLLVGNEAAAKQFIEASLEQGLKLRSRVPSDLSDWTKGVEAFDVLALLEARAVSDKFQAQLVQQREKIFKKKRMWTQKILRAALNERKLRQKRLDSISNYLEPNIKYGPGGLRDFAQAASLIPLSESLTPSEFRLRQLRKGRDFLIACRQFSHFNSGSETLTAQDQLELTRILGFSGVGAFNRQLQLHLSEIHFWSLVALEKMKASFRKGRRDLSLRPQKTSLQSSFKALMTDPGILTQAQVRLSLGSAPRSLKGVKVSPRLVRKLGPDLTEEQVSALFGSRWIDQICPDVKRTRGLVQHDHYHRFTLETHQLQIMRELLRVLKRPKTLGKLSDLVRKLSEQERIILFWSCFFHDLGKGKAGDHSTEGAKLVRLYGAQWGWPRSWIPQMTWLVQNHLILSTAAFRRNPSHPSTWKFLSERGAEGRALDLLALLTALDIRATNPEAWTSWKEQSIANLVRSAQSKEAVSLKSWFRYRKKRNEKLDEELVEGMDPMLPESLPLELLFDDLLAFSLATNDLPLKVVGTQDGFFWIRFHRVKDQDGLFLTFVAALSAVGCSILRASIQTHSQYGVYDWFQVKVRHKGKNFEQRLEWALNEPPPPVSQIKFEKVEVLGEIDGEQVMSFRGKDQKGFLLAAAHSLFAQNYRVHWAKVTTWGRRVDDVIAVSRSQKGEVGPSEDS